MEGNMHGQVAVCKDFIGDYLERKALEDSGPFIFVYTDSKFSAHEAGNQRPDPVGSPVQGVFKHGGNSGELVPNALPRRDHSPVNDESVSGA
jgi:hypothetical protein